MGYYLLPAVGVKADAWRPAAVSYSNAGKVLLPTGKTMSQPMA
jgi:hypothetical protein